jgi:hypothetical protein
MTIRRTVVGKNVEALEGPRLKRLRFGTLSIDDQGIHFKARIMLVLGYAWHLPWDEVADVQLGSDTATRLNATLTWWGRYQATHVTIVDTEARHHGFTVPRVPHESVHNLFLPSMARWNRGTGPIQG